MALMLFDRVITFAIMLLYEYICSEMAGEPANLDRLRSITD